MALPTGTIRTPGDGGEEGERGQRALVGVLPPEEGLQLVRSAGMDVDYRLEVRDKLAVVQNPTEADRVAGVGQHGFRQLAVGQIPPPLLEQDDDLVGESPQRYSMTWRPVNVNPLGPT